MLKSIGVDEESVQEAMLWLKQNLSAEGVRWWVVGVPKIWYSESGTTQGGGVQVTLDVTDKEESIVTAFVLRFAK